MSPESSPTPPPEAPGTPDQTQVIFHLRQGFGPNSDAEVRTTFQAPAAEVASMVTELVKSPNRFIRLNGSGQAFVLVALEHVAWISVDPISEREYRRLREQMDLEGVR